MSLDFRLSAPIIINMRRFAFLIAVMAWLLQSLMPALALPAAHHHGMASSMVAAMPHSGSRHEHGSSAHTQDQHASPMVRHCPDCSAKPAKAACAMSLCAACTPLTPQMMLPPIAPVTAGLLHPLPVPRLPGMTPGPMDPPPRA